MRLYKIWVKDGIIDIIDLTNEYNMVKFSAFSNYKFALTRGPWIIYDYFIVRLWEANFDLEEDKLKKMATWKRLPGLPIHIYDRKLLTSLGNKVGQTIKVVSRPISDSHDWCEDINSDILISYMLYN